MNTILPSVLWAVALLPGAPPPSEAPSDAPTVGRFLVLPNQATLEGDIERIGDQYRVRRAVGETWVGVGNALRLCATAEDVYVFLRDRLRPNDLDGRLRIAEWCRNHDLRTQALAETECILAVRPTHAAAKQFLAGLKQNPVSVPSVTSPTPPPAAALPNVELTADVLNHFAIRVQPILMNTCAGCHNEAHSTTFRLTRVPDSGVANRRTLQQNVAAVLAYVNPAQPMNSAFLAKAGSVHWPTTSGADASVAPFRNRQAPAYRALEDWVRLSAAEMSGSVEVSVATPPSAAPAPEVRTPPITPVKPETTTPFATAKRQDSPPATTEAPATTSGVPDVYSPDDFNRRNHPERVKPAER